MVNVDYLPKQWILYLFVVPKHQKCWHLCQVRKQLVQISVTSRNFSNNSQGFKSIWKFQCTLCIHTIKEHGNFHAPYKKWYKEISMFFMHTYNHGTWKFLEALHVRISMHPMTTHEKQSTRKFPCTLSIRVQQKYKEISMYLMAKHNKTYMEMSMYLMVTHNKRYREISMYLMATYRI